MDNEELTQQMEDTRSALTEKLETLEQQVTDTVQGATSAVSDTVETVKDAIQETVESVKDRVQETVATVKSVFDLPLHVDQHPWAMMAGSMVLGYAVARFLNGSVARKTTESTPQRIVDNHSASTNGAATRSGKEEAATPNQEEVVSLLGGLANQFAPELAKLKGLAVATTLGLVRDVVVDSFSEQLAAPLADIIDSVTRKLGGEPTESPGRQASDDDDDWRPPSMGRAIIT